MATEKEIQLVCEIQRAAIQVNMQGKYHTFVDFSGHVNWIEVRVFTAPYGNGWQPIKGWHGLAIESSDDSYVKLSTGYRLLEGEDMQDVIDYKVECLEKLKADLLGLLEVDADGVPV